jgi:large subunit ribosomal protein L29
MENKDLKNMSLDQLNKKAQEVRKSLFELRMKNTVGQLNNPIEIRDTRKTVARIMTAITAHNKTAAPVAKAAKTAKAPAKTKTTKIKAKAKKTSTAKKK